MIVGFSFVIESKFGDHIHSFCSDCFVVITQHNEENIFWVGKIAVVLNTLLCDWEEAIITKQLSHGFDFLKSTFDPSVIVLLYFV